MFERAVSALTAELKESGIPAVPQYRSGLMTEDRLVCVGLRGGKALSSGMGEYLGSSGGREVFGFRAEMTVSADIFAGSAEDCAELLDALCAALWRLSGAVRCSEFSCGETGPDAATGLYLLPAQLRCAVYFSAEAEDTGEFTDFTLRGVLK